MYFSMKTENQIGLQKPNTDTIWKAAYFLDIAFLIPPLYSKIGVLGVRL